jgi:hypothetical protein
MQLPAEIKSKNLVYKNPSFGLVRRHLIMPHVNDVYSFVKTSVLNVDDVSVAECGDRINALVL